MVLSQWLSLGTLVVFCCLFGVSLWVFPLLSGSGLSGSITSRQALVPGSLQPRGTTFLNATQVMNSLVSKAENKVATWQNGRGAACTLLQVRMPRWSVRRLRGLHSIPAEGDTIPTPPHTQQALSFHPGLQCGA